MLKEFAIKIKCAFFFYLMIKINILSLEFTKILFWGVILISSGNIDETVSVCWLDIKQRSCLSISQMMNLYKVSLLRLITYVFALLTVANSYFIFIFMLKSQFDSTDIYSDQCQSEILIKIDSADRRNASLFNNPECSDFKIIHGCRSYYVHKTVIFKHMNLHVLDLQLQDGILKLPEKFNNEIVKGVISVLYGLEYKVSRSQGLDALDIVHFLQISKLKKLMQQDITEHFQDYELFPLLQKAKQYGLQDIQQLCMEQLERESYEQMRYCKFHLLSCREDVFKQVVHKHNERRWEDPGFGVGEKFIQELISEYCRHNSYGDRQKTQLIRQFNQLSIKSDFSSNSFSKRLSPLTPLKFKQNDSVMQIRVYTPRTTNKTFNFQSNVASNNEVQQQDISRSMIAEVAFMGHKRKKSFRVSDNNSNDLLKLTCEVYPLKDQNRMMQKQYQTMKNNVDKMSKTMKIKETESTNNKYRLSQIEGMLEDCEKLLMAGNRASRLLQVRVNKMEDKRSKNSNSSQFVDDDESGDSDGDDNSKKDEKLSVSLIESKWVCC